MGQLVFIQSSKRVFAEEIPSYICFADETPPSFSKTNECLGKSIVKVSFILYGSSDNKFSSNMNGPTIQKHYVKPNSSKTMLNKVIHIDEI